MSSNHHKKVWDVRETAGAWRWWRLQEAEETKTTCQVKYSGSADGVACSEKKYGKKGYHKFIILCVWKIYEKK
jgi:hypothetical protein